MSLELSGTTPAIKGVAGSVSAPAITGDDADTGISFPAADTIKFSAGGVEKFAISASGLSGDGSGLTGVGGGKILQVLQDTKTDIQSFTVSNSGQYGSILGTISGLSQAITISNASHQILVQGFVSLGSSYSYNTSIGVTLERNGSQIPAATGDADGNRKRQMYSAHIASGARGPTPFYFSYLDTPGSVGTYTYTIEIAHQYAGTGSYYVNAGNAPDNDVYNTRGISVITVMEYDPT